MIELNKWIKIDEHSIPSGKVDGIIMWDDEEGRPTNVTMNDWKDVLSHPYLTHYMVTENPNKVITCNKCKSEFDDEMDIQEFVQINDIGGFCSAWGDGTPFSVKLCSQCSYEMFKDIADIGDNVYFP